MSRCLSCGGAVEVFMDFGPMPIANGFLTPAEFASEQFYDLAAGFCETCSMVQLLSQPPRDAMFNDHYPFFSSLSAGMTRHFEAMAVWLRETYAPTTRSLVVELGCNDGILLQHFARAGAAHLGVEPSANVAERAREKEISVISRFFDESVAEEIVAERGRASALVAANVMCHIPYQDSVLAGVRRLLEPTGVFVVEDPYLGDIVEKTAYDQIYDEHACYFSLLSMERLVARHGLEVIDAAAQSVHGGSMRYVIARTGVRPVSPSVPRRRGLERALGLHRPERYQRFRADIERSRDALMTILTGLRREGRGVVGYGATSKSTTVINYCGISPAHVEFISDTTPEKQGKYSPGAHIPVRPHAEFVKRASEFALLFAWNHTEEIIAKESHFGQTGGRWIGYVPSVEMWPAALQPPSRRAVSSGTRHD